MEKFLVDRFSGFCGVITAWVRIKLDYSMGRRFLWCDYSTGADKVRLQHGQAVSVV